MVTQHCSPRAPGLAVCTLLLLRMWVSFGYPGFLLQSKHLYLISSVCIFPVEDWHPIQGIHLPFALRCLWSAPG